MFSLASILSSNIHVNSSGEAHCRERVVHEEEEEGEEEVFRE